MPLILGFFVGLGAAVCGATAVVVSLILGPFAGLGTDAWAAASKLRALDRLDDPGKDPLFEPDDPGKDPLFELDICARK